MMTQRNTSILNQLSADRSELVGYSRFINNHRVGWQETSSYMIQRTSSLAEGKHVLVINDTTELNYQSHARFLSTTDKELGPVGNNTDIGFFMHPGLVVERELGISMGISYLKLWNRQWDKQSKKERHYKAQKIEEKESYRWIECAEKSKEVLASAATITIIADRESDIYQEFAVIPDAKTNLLIRSRVDRVLKTGGSLYEQLARNTSCGQYKLKVRTTKNRTGRETTIAVKYAEVEIRKPKNIKSSSHIQESIKLYAVEAKEINTNLPAGELPIHWILLTTMPVNNFTDSLQIVQWYGMRWQIELLFSTLKSKGLNIESSEVESGKALKVLSVLALQASIRINQLRQSRNDQTGIPALIAFTQEQIIFIKVLVGKYERKTEKQKNPYRQETLAWAAWVIARMGGWKGYTCESPPGNKTFKIGLDKFYQQFEGFELCKKMCA